MRRATGGRRRAAGGTRRATAALLAGLLATSTPDLVSADAPCDLEPCHELEAPPPVEDHPDWIQLHVGVSGIAPFERSSICPRSFDCVLNGAVGLALTLVSQSARGLGTFASYDIWVADSDSAYEIGVLHALRGGLRYVLDDHGRVHPYLAGSLGLVAFGDPTSIATIGLAVIPAVGAEVELSEGASLIGELDGWGISTLAFRSRDGVERSNGFGVNFYMRLTLGLLVRFGSATVPAS